MIHVASYCRVSTDRDDQANSFETQQCYFRDYIQQHPDWALYEIYADEGITGTSTKKRTQFNRMIHDAYEGKFQLIITKEVSRFSRNILDTIAYTRELKALGIGVIFATDRINTLDPEAEMLLSFLASLAQEESRRTSARVVWGQTRQMEKGVVFGRSMLGYDVSSGTLTVNPEGADIVRLIFHKYVEEQAGTTQIARFLSEQGYHTHSGSTKWTSGTVVKILKNEKYAGDLVQKKTYTPDFLSHEKRPNKGAVPFVTIENHHTPIISRELWKLAQERLRQNNKQRIGGGHSTRYVFSGKIKCGVCGSSFVGRCKYLKDGSMIRRWSCAATVRGGRAACSIGKLLRNDDAMHMLKTAIMSLPMDFSTIARNTAELVVNAMQDRKSDSVADPRKIESELQRIQKKKEAVMDSCFSGELSKADMQAMLRKYDGQIEELRCRLLEAELRRQSGKDRNALLESICSEVAGILDGDIESEAFFKATVENLTVFPDRHTELRLKYLAQVFHFSDGVQPLRKPADLTVLNKQSNCDKL